MWNRRNLLRAGGATVAGGAAVAVLPGISHGSTGRRRRDRWETLRGRLTGRLVLPSDEGYDLSRQSHYAMYDTVRPQAVAQCETTADVQECVRFATEQGIPLRVRSGGHNFAGWSIGEGLVVDLFRMKNVSVTAGGSTVHVGPGSTSIETISALEPHGLQLPTGTCPTVAPGGFLTGGGIGHQTRKFGLGSDRLVSARVVLADGRAVLASEREHPDLFWALAGGGGGNYGIVTDFELRPVDAPSMVFYQSMWSVDRAPEVLAAWQRWIADAPDDLGSMIALVRPRAAPHRWSRSPAAISAPPMPPTRCWPVSPTRPVSRRCSPRPSRWRTARRCGASSSATSSPPCSASGRAPTRTPSCRAAGSSRTRSGCSGGP